MTSVEVPIGRRTRQRSRAHAEGELFTYNEQQQQELEGDASRKPKKRRRGTRGRTACEPCRVRKVRCDRKHPCTPCTLHQDDCYYEDAQPLPDIGEIEDEDELAIANAEIERLGRLVESLNAQSGISPAPQLKKTVPRTAQRFRDVSTPCRLPVFRFSRFGDPHPGRERSPTSPATRQRDLNQSIHLSTSIRSSLYSYGYQSPSEWFDRGQGAAPSKVEGAESFVRTGSEEHQRENAVSS